MLKVSMIGCGAIGASVLDLLKNDADITITSVIIGDEFRERAQETLTKIAPHAQLVSNLSQATERPDVVVECAGHGALAEHVIPALEQGIPCVVGHRPRPTPRAADQGRAGARSQGARLHRRHGA